MTKILLINENIYGTVSNEETFWSILAKNLQDAKALALKDFKGNLIAYLNKIKPDVLIFNSILGDIKIYSGCKKIVLLQDNFILMDKIIPKTLKQKLSRFLKGNRHFYAQSIIAQKEAIKNADEIIAVSNHIAQTYGVSAEIIPIGTDTQLFSPLNNRQELKIKYALPLDKKIKIFVGSTHPVKGFDILKEEIENDKNSFYILVLKDEEIPKLNYPNIKICNRVSQKQLAELYNCSDLYVGRSRVESLWLTPVEAMFCNIPIDVTPVGIFADWQPDNKNPRQEAFAKGLDRETMIRKWQELIAEFS
jgi:hypothetical protein